jgi:prepilin-type N-terminal cleavage/methylation domain-containing protein
MISDRGRRFKRSRGFTLIELLIVMGIAVILLVIALPSMMSQRRLMRFNGATREFLVQLRHARQLAMSERQAITFQYDDDTKVIRIIDHNNDPIAPASGTAVLADVSYPNTASPAVVVHTVSLVQGGLQSAEIKYGVPGTADGLPVGHLALPTSLGDAISMTALPTSKKINITFQADGSVVSPAGVPTGGVTLSAGTRLDSAIFLFDTAAPAATATAISVLGASGRVKVWRYNDSANTFIE